jgi:hypothetical protein
MQLKMAKTIITAILKVNHNIGAAAIFSFEYLEKYSCVRTVGAGRLFTCLYIVVIFKNEWSK